MKKATSILLVLILLSSIFSTNALANQYDPFGDISQYTDSELDLTQYTMDDIVNMTAEEYLYLVAEFERVYDPYNSYVERDINTGNLSNLSMEETISPRWTSGDIEDDEYTEEGSHEYISSVACVILNNDTGFFADNTVANVVIALSISLASLLPDKDDRGTIPYLFDGHFYDPDTKTNYHGDTTNTAKTNASANYKKAIEAAKDDDMAKAYEYLGRCLHYVQDANEPHHAANVHALDGFYGLSHSAFENHAFENQGTYLENYNTITEENYTNATSWTIAKITHVGAGRGKAMIEYVRDITNKDDWDVYAEKSMKNAARYSTMVLYKFGSHNSVPFFYN